MTSKAPLARITAHPGSIPTIIGAGVASRSFPHFGATNEALLVIDAGVLKRHMLLAEGARWVLEFDSATQSQQSLLDRLTTLIHREEEVTSVVGIGGGSTMDAAKLVRLSFVSKPSLRAAQQYAGEFGIYLVPEAYGRRSLPLVLAPTTLGTGSEASSVACLEGTGSRRLVAGSKMRADSISVDPTLTRSLGEQGLREGTAEILLRIIGGYVGSPPGDVQDVAAEELAGRVARLARTALDVGFDERVRTLLAVASGETHTGWALAGRDPYAAKHWYLANEISFAGGARKVPATLRILPAIWRRAMSGDHRFGDADRLRRIWQVIASELSLSPDPVEGASAWRVAWDIDLPDFSDVAIESAAKSCFRTWAGRRPALHGISEDEIVAVYAA
ncbi:hypothetical protein C5C31_09255 [Rathayibacter rathayi]|uniref:iron-containing alcohol dehydrogenase n=1 Tax=Rathayibacter rathayi TaxID=33887 RepID=UPI000CE90720|nr:iron-containing alcohol dehydrogenase [Rathayibacter rathayi]PPG67578.1 hypothetical protein C5C02_09495 [Rathayibacter rathayi]PPG76565.1 hypothetical protein C5C23_07500 [Rathayibacter rathayi]PPH22253.1 hypothetical protein C5C31_09255 [Rathayibacter rathayi]PPH36995.1 hypothetical protein C5C28_04820 [Rathayibacter rathayi]PPH64285.1 hypothetical protein C5C45_12865 [Rathayibacter rathayi]